MHKVITLRKSDNFIVRGRWVFRKNVKQLVGKAQKASQGWIFVVAVFFCAFMSYQLRTDILEHFVYTQYVAVLAK